MLISWSVPTLCLHSGIVSPHWLCWVKGVCVFRCNLPSALLAEWLGSFTCHWGNTGGEWTLTKSQLTKLNYGEENSPAAPAGIRTTTYWSRVWRSTDKLSQLPGIACWQSVSQSFGSMTVSTSSQCNVSAHKPIGGTSVSQQTVNAVSVYTNLLVAQLYLSK